MILQAEKYHNLQSTGWKPGKANGVVPVQGRRPEKQQHRCPSAEKRHVPTQAENKFAPPLSYGSVPALSRLNVCPR